MEIKFEVNDSETITNLGSLSSRQFMIAWTTVVQQLAQKQARNKIGGDFGHNIGNSSILTDNSNPLKHEVYVGGENGYIAEHVHTGGIIRPKNSKFLAIPIDKKVKGIFAKEYNWPGGAPVFLQKKNEGANGRCFLAEKMKTKVKPLYVLKRSVMQKPRPWWPTDNEVANETINFFENEI